MEGVAYFVIVSDTNVAGVFQSGAALLLVQEIDNMVGLIAQLLIKPYGEFLLIKEKDENLARLYCVYTSIHTVSQFFLLMAFSISAYLYDPSHKLMLGHWLPYAVVLITWFISIIFIDIFVALRFKNGKEMFDRMLAGFTLRPDSLVPNGYINHLDKYDNFMEGGQRQPKAIKYDIKDKVALLSNEVENLKNENFFLKEKNKSLDQREMQMEKKFSDLQAKLI